MAAQSFLMIRPINFGFNPQTATDNTFQKQSSESETSIQARAQEEFDIFVHLLIFNGIDIVVVQDTEFPVTPDSIFPNNWISFHSDGTMCLYPMFAENRRLERKISVLDLIYHKFIINSTLDFTPFEIEGKYLEGTGSMIFDRTNEIVYASRSGRMHEDVLRQIAPKLGFNKIVIFESRNEAGVLIYHTNVMMCVADEYVVICLDAIENMKEREEVQSTIENTGKLIVEITLEQLNNFAGNMLQVQNGNGKKFLIMSSRAFWSLRTDQVQQLEKYNDILHSDLSTIEDNGGGSARCMMAEIYLPKK